MGEGPTVVYKSGNGLPDSGIFLPQAGGFRRVRALISGGPISKEISPAEVDLRPFRGFNEPSRQEVSAEGLARHLDGSGGPLT